MLPGRAWVWKMGIKLVDLPNGEDVICFKGKDAEGKQINKYVCALSDSQEAVHLAFIDLTKGQPSVSHVVLKKYGREDKPEFFSHLREASKKRFSDFDQVEEEEREFLDSLLSKSSP